MEKLWGDLGDLIKGAGGIVYHIVVVALSAGVALSLPVAVRFYAQNLPAYWSLIEDEKILLVSLEIAVAVLLIACINYLRRSMKDRKLAGIAAGAGFVGHFPTRGRLAQRKIRKLKKKHGIARSVMVIGSTGYNTFVDPKGDLHTVLQNCLEAKILLLNPYSQAALARARAILNPDVTCESFPEQVGKCIDFLKRLKAAQKSVSLKLYSDPPHVKLAILGDYIWLQHYHAGLDVHTMPEYVLKHRHNGHGLYTLFYQYFIKRWESPDIPEYDLETDEVVYRSSNGSEVKREMFRGNAGDPDSPASDEEIRTYTSGV